MPNDLDIRATRQGQTPSEDDLFWPEAMRRVQVDVMPSAHTAAGRVITLNGISWVVGALALLWNMVEVGHTDSAIADLIVWFVPLGFWSISAILALKVFTVRRYRYFANSPDSTREAVIRIARKKINQLYWSIGLWSAGVVAFLIAVISERL